MAAGTARAGGGDHVTVNAAVGGRGVGVGGVGDVVVEDDGVESVGGAAEVVEQGGTPDDVKVRAGRRRPVERHAVMSYT